MARDQPPPSKGFPNVQQNPVRNQFSGGQIVSGPMGPQQGMASSQQFGGGVSAGVNPNPNTPGTLNVQQVMTQQQLIQHQQQIQLQLMLQQQQKQKQQQQQQQQKHRQQQQQQQHKHQLQLQLQLLQLQQQHQQQQQQQQQPHQQQQQATLAQQNRQVFVTPATHQMPAPQSQPPVSRPSLSRDYNTASLCKSGQDFVREILIRMKEAFKLLKDIQPPTGDSQGQKLCIDRKKRIQELVSSTAELFKTLRVLYEKFHENYELQGMDYTDIESLIPVKEEWDMKSADEKKASDAYRLACEEHKEVKEQLVLKNKQLKEIIDHLRRIISEVNTMMSMRRS